MFETIACLCNGFIIKSTISQHVANAKLVELGVSPKFSSNWFCHCLKFLQIDETDHGKIAYKHQHACQMVFIIKNSSSPNT